MNIQGLQKLTLLDYPDRLACTVFTGLCNLRCPFCHNASLISGGNSTIEWNEVLKFIQSRVGILEGVCVTGGEPTLQKNLSRYLMDIKELGFLVKLDTNGTRPKVLKDLVANALVDYIALDVKNSPNRYGETVGIQDFDLSPIEESMEFLLTDAVEYEFRTTIVKDFHDEADLLELANWIKGTKQYFLQSFVDGEDVLQKGLSSYSKEEITHLKEAIKPIIPVVQLRGV